MASLVLTGDTSGAGTITVPAVAGTFTATFQSTTGTVALTSDVIGVSQTWQDVTASRAVGTTYTNSTGKPIFIVVACTGSANNARVVITTGGVAIVGNGAAGSGFYVNNSAIIPAGSTYVVSTPTGTLTLQSWTELR
jgi:hypothetical protein